MLNEWIVVGLGFIEGFALILSPCILPVLPLVLAGSLTGGMRRTWGIIAGFVGSFTLLAFASRQLVLSTGLDLTVLRQISLVLLVLLGVTLLSVRLTSVFNQVLRRGLNLFSSQMPSVSPGGGFLRGFMLGGLISVVWTPCAGPILATVIVQIATQQSNVISVVTLLAFACGSALPMLLIAVWSKQLVNSMGWFAAHGVLVRRILGGIILCAVGFLAWQETIQAAALSSADNLPVRVAPMSLEQGLWQPYAAPSLQGGELWFNSKPLSWADLKGRVVLIDFWTYSCINCIRTLPEIRQLAARYQGKGLVVIGVHAPEFAFEHQPENVQAAMKRYGISYPVVLDNQFIIWRAFNNHYWPAQYLVDRSGRVVYQHFGEGSFDVLDNNIRFLLKLPPVAKDSATVAPILSALVAHETAETYLGYARADSDLSPKLTIHDRVLEFIYPVYLPVDAWGLHGAWVVHADTLVASAAQARIKLHFSAHQVYAVMGPGALKSVVVRVRLNGQPIAADKAGRDVLDGQVKVDMHRLYHLVDLKQSGRGVVELVSEQSGLTLYTFTFGS